MLNAKDDDRAVIVDGDGVVDVDNDIEGKG